jgi:hypothetical protein
MYREGQSLHATPSEPPGLAGCPLSCKALDYLEIWAVPSALGTLETQAMGPEGTLRTGPVLPFSCFRSRPPPHSPILYSCCLGNGPSVPHQPGLAKRLLLSGILAPSPGLPHGRAHP